MSSKEDVDGGPSPAMTAGAQLPRSEAFIAQRALCSELGEMHCFKSKPTERYFPATISDYYSLWMDDCGSRMFIKLPISGDRPVITSFKKDNRYG